MEEKYIGVSGWLLFFCLILTILTPVASIYNIAAVFKTSSPHFMQYPGLKVITAVDTILSFGIVCFSIYAGVALWRIKKNAVKIAKTYLLTFMAYAIIANILPFTAGLPSSANEAMIAQAFIGILRTSIIVALWYLYLTRSRRVRATYSL